MSSLGSFLSTPAFGQQFASNPAGVSAMNAVEPNTVGTVNPGAYLGGVPTAGAYTPGQDAALASAASPASGGVGPAASYRAAVPGSGVSWGQILNAAQAARGGNYAGAFNSIVPQQSQPGMMQGLTFPEDQKKQDSFGQILGLALKMFAA